MAEKKTEKSVAETPEPDVDEAAAETPATETVPGGKYIVGDRYQNAEGEDLGAAPKKDRA